MSRSIETKLARLEARAVHLLSDMTDELLARRIDQWIRLHPAVEERDPPGRSPFAAMTERQIVAYAMPEGWI
jgi:hypothetical protein